MLNGRPATEEDFEFLWQLHRSELKPYVEKIWGWDEAWQKRYFRDHFDPTHQRIVMEGDARIGTIKVEEREGAIFLAYIVICRSYQGDGRGTALIREVMERARTAGLPVELKVLNGNPARKLYERLGFEVTRSEETHLWMKWEGVEK